ncbi:glycerophosphodiester phosphodiesterase family protein [Saccharopolyspora mangrovi]|uniref:Glycerophosphodiester phosphodiesterase family protein n=1 Tax=Saccharopolyspora mangrovi TaxID=3082379 RepID=A0ABU6AD93_9PSEU|nr:glycerophosphodiester phosphodiesterase family protein [Saccharopolyspora sp. S2-29]MEB3369521.1 glycerophosphodiester phosphodiesterase family protein [Saccharopolyspora sp. S2-29]
MAAPSSASQTAPIERIHRDLLNHSADAPLMAAAHRGAWRDYPENSLAAIDEAVRDGAEIVEIDVRKTADGHLVLMHDETVDRTTNGSGKVSDLTLAQIKQLRLKEHLGGEQTALTSHAVPTLEEAMLAVKGRAMVNLDKGWSIHEDMYRVLKATGTVNHGLFKGSPTVQEAADFMAKDPEILYMHILKDENANVVGTFPGRQPVAYEIVFDQPTDPQVQPGLLEKIQRDSRVWINTMWNDLAAQSTDEDSRRDARLGWETVVSEYDASMIQTDEIEGLHYWRNGGDMRRWEAQPGNRTVRVQAEDHAPGGEGVGYHDLDPNTCGTEGDVDVCDIEGAIAVSSIQPGEWIKYTVDIPRPGSYEVSARLASSGVPAGRIAMTWANGATDDYDIGNTTDARRAFDLQPIQTRHFEAGKHEFVVKIDQNVAPNFNLDLFQFDLK